MPKFMFTELSDARDRVETARLGAGTGAANFLGDAEVGKAVKLVADSRYDLVAVGNEIEGFIEAIETATQDNFTIGSVRRTGRKVVTFDGLQASPGTGVVAIGDFVVAGTPVAKGTALTAPVRVCKATAAPEAVVHQWRVVSLGSAGSGAVGTTGLIEKLT